MEHGYSSREARSASGLSPRMLHAIDHRGLVGPSVQRACGTGSARRWNLADLVALRIVKVARDIGLPFNVLRGVQAAIAGADLEDLRAARLVVTLSSERDGREASKKLISRVQLLEPDAEESRDAGTVYTVLELAPVVAHLEGMLRLVHTGEDRAGVA